MFFSKIAAIALSVFALGALAVPTSPANPLAIREAEPLVKRGPDCSNLPRGLSLADCQHMSNIGMASTGINSYSNNGLIWIGSDGPNTMTFHNLAGGVPVTLVVWYDAPGDYSASFMGSEQAYVTFSLTGDLSSVTISLANGVSGGFAGLYNELTDLTAYGQINNTWGEFTTGADATIDVSREINMNGNGMSINVSTGCVSNLSRCYFGCIDGNSGCWEANTYQLYNCEPTSQTGATYGLDAGQPSGGCQGWSNGGQIDITFYDH